MYPIVPVELFSSAAALITYLFTVFAVLITVTITSRG
jgi:hypothetical protein